MLKFVESHLKKAPARPESVKSRMLPHLGDIYRPSDRVVISERSLVAHQERTDGRRGTKGAGGAGGAGGADDMVHRWLFDTPEVFTEAPAGMFS